MGLRHWHDKAVLSRDLCLQDCRVTVSTRLLKTAPTLSEIANLMAWPIRHAANVIEHFARVSPSNKGGVPVKPAQAKGGGQ
ncbi:hypothetical protein [Roseisalinus antarcticus]|uniref:hypothetical protein n=1 Tax=Roseisalinus antarcticus TaxID=254357 RepID=UPI000A270CB9|nr:hypothetical protein [Roseisalinus antarcticus]